MMIKIWTADDQCVIADVSLNKTLTCAAFLNSSADIVFSFANNIYSVAFKTCKYMYIWFYSYNLYFCATFLKS